MKNRHRCSPLAGVVADRGRGLPQTCDRVLRRAADAVGPDETAAGALFHTAVRRHVADGHRRRRAGQQPERDAHRGRTVRGPPRVGHRHADVRCVLRGAQVIRRPPAVGQAAAAPARVHRRRFRVHAVYPAADLRMTTRSGCCADQMYIVGNGTGHSNGKPKGQRPGRYRPTIFVRSTANDVRRLQTPAVAM